MEGMFCYMNKTKIIEQEKKDCCGCAACESICPTRAISMISDVEGFLYPKVDVEKCTGCGLCERTCAFKIKDINNRKSTICEQYAIKYTRENIRSESQAGGSFAALAISLLENNENVSIYGAAFDTVYQVKHIAIHDESEIAKLQKSKYIQSDMQGVYQNIENDVKCGRIVMFAGTPCQNHAVKQYLNQRKVDMSSVYLMDFICEGVGSPYVWQQYLKILENKYKKGIKKVVFRDKRLGWINHFESIQMEGFDKMIISRRWTNLFYDKLFFRESCHNCKYTSLNRESDITVSWFGNVKIKYPEINDNGGISGVMINTEKGKAWFSSLQGEIECKKVSMDDLMQKQLRKPIEKSPLREQFWKDFLNDNKWKTIKKYDTASWKYHMKRFVKNIIQRKCKWI